MPSRTFECLAAVLAPLSLCFACASTIDDEASTYPGPDEAASCATAPSLCGLALHDLGGGADENAWHIVFVGDGYLDDEQLDFARRADEHTAAMLHPDGIFIDHDLVAHGPELFHFWRIDVASNSIEVDNDDVTDTPLGAHLAPPDNCVGRPLIRAQEDRLALAMDEAVVATPDEEAADRLRYRSDVDTDTSAQRDDDSTRWPHAARRPVTSSRATFVLLSHRSSGRANATLGGDVRMSSRDDSNVLAHELGHALFGLGDEYTEFSSCDLPPSKALQCGPPADVNEVALLETPNTSTFHDGEKWAHDVDSSVPGGNRWPCHAHPTDSCLMLDGRGSLCSVCSSAVAERVAMRRCAPDTRAPRVAIEPGPTIFGNGTKALLAASAFDERSASTRRTPLAISWVLDDDADDQGDGVEPTAVIARGPFAVVDLPIPAGRSLRAIASDGRFTARSSAVALPTSPPAGDDADERAALALAPLAVAGASTVVQDATTGEVLQLVGGIGARVTVSFRPQSCVRVARAGVEVRSDDGDEQIFLVTDLGDDNRVNCGDGTPPSLRLSFDRPATGEQFKLQGFLTDVRGRSAVTLLWTPHAIDDESCPLDQFARDESERSVHGPFDGTVVTTNASLPLWFDVRVGHMSARASPVGTAKDGIAVLPVALGASTGEAFDVALLAACAVPSTRSGAATSEWVTASTRILFAWDNEPPAIAASSSVPPDTAAWDIAVVDDSAVTAVTVEPRGGNGEAITLRTPPWRVSPPPRGPVTIRAVDAAGNVATHDFDVVEQQSLDPFVECR